MVAECVRCHTTCVPLRTIQYTNVSVQTHHSHTCVLCAGSLELHPLSEAQSIREEEAYSLMQAMRQAVAVWWGRFYPVEQALLAKRIGKQSLYHLDVTK